MNQSTIYLFTRTLSRKKSVNCLHPRCGLSLYHPPWYLLLLLLVITTILAGCLARPLDSVPQSLLGTWHTDASVRLPIAFVPETDPDPTDDVKVTVAIVLTIHEDGTVTGTIGDAQLVNCILKQNRGELGRQLNLATDYIIMGGYLSGFIVPEDEETEKAFTIPFNSVDNQIVGSLFWVKEWKYPLPLMPRIELVKE